jgi:UDP-3-O-[3-hydroxymyristoyl] N-acetylglucosamine deacetylase
MQFHQKTLLKSVSFSGVGIHSGLETTVVCHPAPAGHGIVFVRTDLEGARVPMLPQCLVNTSRYTSLKYHDAQIDTPEHLLAACAGLSLHNLVIEIDGRELPILDGSSQVFCDAFLAAGTVDQGLIKPLVITDMIRVSDQDRLIEVRPSKRSYFEYHLSYPNSFVGEQTVGFDIGEGDFATHIAPARTYGFEHEVAALLRQGLAKGGSLDNAVVIGELDYLTPLRFECELARHKVLDLIGDFWILGRPVVGDVIAYKSGHALTAEMVRKLQSSSIPS